jgi:signal transduction histidine kinase
MASLYVADFVTMHLFPMFMSMSKAMEFMMDLHLNFSFLLSAIGSSLIAFGIVYTNRVLFPELLSRQERLVNTKKMLEEEIVERLDTEKKLRIYQGNLRTLVSRLSTVEIQERNQISEELHDNIGQYLAISAVKLNDVSSAQPGLTESLIEPRKLIDEAIKFTRTLTFKLGNPILYQLGLGAALEWFADQMRTTHDMLVQLEVDEKLKGLKGETSDFLFNSIRELLYNVIRHAQAQKATVSIFMNQDNIHVEIEDDGVGFDTSDIECYSLENMSFGIFNITERIKCLDGDIKIKSILGQGTRVEMDIPMQQ